MNQLRSTKVAADFILVLLRYIENINSISIYRIVSYRRGNTENFDISVSSFYYLTLPNFH